MRRAISTAAAMLAVVSVLLPAMPALAGYGAVAWDKETGKSGWSWNQATAQRAADQASSKCATSGCKVIMRIGPANCAAFATTQDAKYVGAASRKTVDAARLAALANCKKGNAGDCVIRASDCNK